MKTDLSKIRKFAKEKEDENWRFRTFLKSYDIKKLDSIVYKLFKQISEAIDCTTCGNCCKEIKPGVNKTDIDKWSKSLNITQNKFITNYVEKNDVGENVLKQTPCLFLMKSMALDTISTEPLAHLTPRAMRPLGSGGLGVIQKV